MAGIGYGKYSARQVLAKLAPARKRAGCATAKRKSQRHSPAWCGASSAATQQRHHASKATATCWSIARAAATRFAAKPLWDTSPAAKGVAVTRMNCPNVMNLMYEPERRIDVEWARER